MAKTLLRTHVRFRSKMGAGEREAFLVFPILAALAKKPMKIMDLVRLLYVTRETVARRLRELERKGWVVQKKDGKWVVVVRLRVEGAPVPSQVAGSDPVLGMEAGEVSRDPASDVLPAAVGLQDRVPIADATDARQRPQTASEKVAAKFKVPDKLAGRGELSISTVGPCSICERPTMLKYGNDKVCPSCARNWTQTQATITSGQAVEG